MRWPPWSSKDPDEKNLVNWTDTLNARDEGHYTDPRNAIPVLLLTATVLGSYSFYRSYLRRMPQATLIQPRFWRKRSLFGKVTKVGDGDGFRLFHMPGGRLAGWEWLPWRKVPERRAGLKDNTVSIRIAGIDAPEGAHFGRPAQPYSKEALDWLTDYILHRRVRAYIYRKDQFDRAVATVYVRRWLLRRDVGYQMLKLGLATVYEAKTGVEFGPGLEKRYRRAEWWAKTRRKGLWAGTKQKDFETPREYKTRQGLR